MNYLAELIAFYDRLELNPLSSPEIALWHALMSIANKTGWQQEFTVAVSILMLKSGLNAQAIKRARNRLEQDGFITWRSRKGNQSAIYHINSLVVQKDNKNVPQSVPQLSVVVQNSPKFVPQSVPQYVPQSEPQSVPINKHKHKQNINNIPPISPITRFDDFWEAFPNKQRRYLTQTAYCNLIVSGTVSENQLVIAAQNYAVYIQESGDKMCLPNNFLENYVFEDYLESKQKIPEKEKETETKTEEKLIIGDDWINCQTPWGR